MTKNKGGYKALLALFCYLLSFTRPDPAVFLAPVTKNIFLDDPPPLLFTEAEWKDCRKDL